MKYGVQKAGMRKVCEHCGGTDLVHGAQVHCNTCKKSTKALEMHFSEIKSYKKELEARERVHHWSWRRCEEISAFWMLATAIILLLAFIYLA